MMCEAATCIRNGCGWELEAQLAIVPSATVSWRPNSSSFCPDGELET